MNVIAPVLLTIALLLAIPLVICVGVLAWQIVADASIGQRSADDEQLANPFRPSVAVLVPAHNEQSGIAATIAALLPQLAADDRLLVVADNCSDATSTEACAAGAEVIERSSELRGKGYALGYGVDHMRSNPPSAVVIVDADCELAPGALDELIRSLVVTGRPVQALYLMLAPDDATLGRRLAQFAWRVRNWVRPAGWHRLGLPCQLMGTGMAFSWVMLKDAQLANASIVEDMKLGIDLAIAGTPPVFCSRALVTSQFPDSVTASGTQRTRWEHGHIEMIFREVPALLRAAFARRDVRLLGLALDLAVPPLALLAGLLVLDGLFAGAGWLLGSSVAACGLVAVLLCVFVASILLAWASRGRDLVRLIELLSVPWYIFAKVPIYLRFFVRRQKDWVRTDRK